MTDPIAVADFWEQLHFAGRPEFVPQQNGKQSRDGGGNVLAATFGVAPKWVVDVTLADGRHNHNLLQQVDINRIDRRNLTFLAYDLRNPWPAFDPGGAKIGDRSVLIKTKGTDNTSISLEGLSKKFTITKGDKISIAYGSGKIFLCEVQANSTGDASGDSPEFQIEPYLPVNVAVGDAVTLLKAPAKFKIVKGSYRPSSGAGNSASGPSFSMISVP